MCDKQVSGLQKILHSSVTGVPRIMLRRAEEIFPSVRESMVVVVCTVLLAKETKCFMMSLC
jgi:hypothetical protein